MIQTNSPLKTRLDSYLTQTTNDMVKKLSKNRLNLLCARRVWPLGRHAGCLLGTHCTLILKLTIHRTEKDGDW